MTSATLAGLVGAALVGLGLYGLIASTQPLRKILAFNLMGSGVFLVFGIIARKGAAGLRSRVPPTHNCEERLVRRSSTSEGGSDEAIHSFLLLHGLLRGACHRARIRATCWLAMTV